MRHRLGIDKADYGQDYDGHRHRQDGRGRGLRQDTHDHADFAVYVRGQRLDFDRPEFLSTEDKDLSKNVHIHAPRANVVHIHREQTTWDDFFASLGMAVDDNCLTLSGGEKLCNGGTETLKFFVNGVRIDP